MGDCVATEAQPTNLVWLAVVIVMSVRTAGLTALLAGQRNDEGFTPDPLVNQSVRAASLLLCGLRGEMNRPKNLAARA
jgi:hypothetical protein